MVPTGRQMVGFAARRSQLYRDSAACATLHCVRVLHKLSNLGIPSRSPDDASRRQPMESAHGLQGKLEITLQPQ